MNNLKPKNWRTKTSTKTIDINTKTWWDKINGNTYFSSVVTINHGLKNEFSFSVKYQYGYGNAAYSVVLQILKREGIIPSFKYNSDLLNSNIIIRENKQEYCKKREVTAFGLSCENSVYS